MNGCGSCSTTWRKRCTALTASAWPRRRWGCCARVFIMDFGDGKGVIEAVNPRIVERRGKQEDVEGCLSSPGEYGITRRPRRVKMVAQDRFGKEFTFEGEDLSARCVCHEYDHLDGILFKQHVVRMLDPEDLA